MKNNDFLLIIVCIGLMIIALLLSVYLPDIIHNQEEIIKLLEKANEHNFELKF